MYYAYYVAIFSATVCGMDDQWFKSWYFLYNWYYTLGLDLLFLVLSGFINCIKGHHVTCACITTDVPTWRAAIDRHRGWIQCNAECICKWYLLIHATSIKPIKYHFIYPWYLVRLAAGSLRRLPPRTIRSLSMWNKDQACLCAIKWQHCHCIPM